MSIKAGYVYKVDYLNILNKKRKVFSFIGLCISSSKKHKTFILRNIFNKEVVELTFPLYSPFIIKLQVLQMFNFNFTKSKLFFKKIFWIKQVPNKAENRAGSLSGVKINFNKYVLPPDYKKVQFREVRDKYRIKFTKKDK